MHFEDRRVTFAEHANRTRKLASALHGAGMRHQDRVAMLAMNCSEYNEFYGVAELSGFIAAAINYRLAPPEFAYIVNDCTPKVLIFESQYASLVDGLRDKLPSVQHYVCIGGSVPIWAAPYEEFLASGDAAGPPVSPVASDIITILYTSGTTGRPKGVMATHEAGMWIAEMQTIEMSTDVGDRFLIVMPMYHLGGRAMQSGQHLRGGTVVLHRKFDPADVARSIQEDRITQVHLAPTMLQAVLDLPDIDRYDVSSVKSLMHAAAPISVALRRRALRKFGPILVDGYGSTETGGTMLRKNQQKIDGTPQEQKRLASVGQAMLHCEAKIVDDNDVEVERGQVGELCFKSPQTMKGYWNNAAATIEALRGGWMHTGDMAYMDEEGFLYLVDRKKDMIISGGENIYSREVEEALMSHADVSDAAVVGMPDAYWGESVLAIVVCNQGKQVAADALIAHCKTQIASYKAPKRVEYVDALPRLPSGKVNKVALREQFVTVTGKE
jgi:acyl-CoA synthetase (AMP-forming)/AMP-acid ligase II